jgi:hypothetical protein
LQSSQKQEKNGDKFEEIILLSDIPQGHKVALKDLSKGDAVLRYGVELGYLLEDVKQGGWINEHMLVLPEQPFTEGPAIQEARFRGAPQHPSGQPSKDMRILMVGMQERAIFLPSPLRCSVSAGWLTN